MFQPFCYFVLNMGSVSLHVSIYRDNDSTILKIKVRSLIRTTSKSLNDSAIAMRFDSGYYFLKFYSTS
jgi:hypothetical protein